MTLRRSPLQGDLFQVQQGEISPYELVNYSGRPAKYVWDQRGRPALPTPDDLAREQPLRLVGDCAVRGDLVHTTSRLGVSHQMLPPVRLPVAWPAQEGIDIMIMANPMDVTLLPHANEAAFLAEHKRKRLLGCVAMVLLDVAVLPDNRWMLKPAPLRELLVRALELAGIMVDAFIEAGTPIERMLQTTEKVVLYRDIPLAPSPLDSVEQIYRAVNAALGSTYKAHDRRVPGWVVVPDLGKLDLVKILNPPYS